MQYRYTFSEDASANTYEPLGRVVPADGDPEVEAYRAAVAESERQRRAAPWVRSRRVLRGWAITLGALALALLFIKPLLVVAAVVVAAVLGLILLGLLVAGALLIAFRLSLGSRVAYFAGRGGAFRRAGRWRHSA